jgi:lipid-A-disaccharide synthase
MVVHVKFISLPNLILNRKIVTELIQYKFTAKSLSAELSPLLSDTPVRIKMLEDYQELKKKTGNPGASVRAAHKIYEHLINK